MKKAFWTITHIARNSLLLLLLLLAAGTTAVLAVEHDTAVSAQDRSQPAASSETVLESAAVTIHGRPIVAFRRSVHGVSPAERAKIVEERIKLILSKPHKGILTTRNIPEGILFLIDGQEAIIITPGDLAPIYGETEAVVIERAKRNLALAMAEIAESRSLPVLLRAAGLSALATIVFGLFTWLIVSLQRRLWRFLQNLEIRWADKLQLHKSNLLDHVVPITRLLSRMLFIIIELFTAYTWLTFCLTRFPQTRTWGESLGYYFLKAMQEIGSEILNWIPDLFAIVIIVTITRIISRMLKTFFSGIEEKRISLAWIHHEVARPTSRIAQLLLWLFALIMMYPYLPGSQTAAFKGVSVLLGVMISFGSTSIVNQATGGLVLMYSMAFRAGDIVRVSDTEGIVLSLGVLSTRIRTASKEEVIIPNAVMVGNMTHNFSRFPEAAGALISTTVTIGYSTSWRKVQEMMMIAAQRTPDLVQNPPPFVLQKTLSDFYVEYQLNAVVEKPENRASILSALNANIQDVFNEHGEQIMSPHYVSDPPEKVWVPKDRWYELPAKAPESLIISKE